MTPEEKAAVRGAATQKADTARQEAATAATMTAMTTVIQKAIAEAVAPIQKSVTDLATDVAGLKGAVKKTDKLMQSTVIGAVPAADHEGAAQVSKQEVGELGNIDTAYTPGVRTRKSYAERAGRH